MNKAQKVLREILSRVPDDDTNSQLFLRACIHAWEGYDEMMYSYPHWQLRKIEELFKTTAKEIDIKYNAKEKKEGEGSI